MNIKKIFNRAPHYIKVLAKLKTKDVILVSYPKSGNTWVRNIIANYIGITELDKKEITFKELDEIMPGLGRDNYFKPWPYLIPKFCATHFKYLFFFKKTRNVLVIRDPRDVMVSYFYYINNKKNDYYFDDLFDLLIHPEFGLENWFKHTNSWMNKVDFVIVYEEMLDNDTLIIQEMFDLLTIKYNEEILHKAIKNSRFDKFKKIEETHGHSNPETIKEEFKFARKGISGDYINHFDDKCYQYYEAALKKYGFQDYNDIIKTLRP